MNQIIFFFTIFLGLACGITEYKHVEYESTEREGNPIGLTCSIQSLAYQSELESIVNETCVNCHLEGRMASSVFSFYKDSSKDQEIFANLLKGDPEAIIRKLTGVDPHGGGAILENGSPVETYFKAIQLCD